MGNTTDFKICTCGTNWADRRSFILDPDILPIGITFPPDQSSLRVHFFFNHTACETTLAVNGEAFEDLIEESIPADIMAGEDDCGKHCSTPEDLMACSIHCRNAPYRRFFLDRIMKKNI